MGKRSVQYLFLFISAVLTGLAVAFSQIGAIEWLTLIPVAIVLLNTADTTKLRNLYGRGLFFFFSYYVVIFHWFIDLYPLDFISGMTPATAAALVLVSTLGLSALQAFFGGFVFLVFGLFCRTHVAKKYSFSKPFFMAALWAVYEWTQTLGWFGVPWGRLPIGQSRMLAELQTASLFGSYFITFLIVAVNFILAYALLMPEKRKLCAAVALSLVLGNTLAGTLLYLTNSDNDKETVRVAVIQGNISSQEKWSIESTKKTKEIYARYTRQAAADGAKIVIWPETAVPYVLESSSFDDFVRDLAVETETTILVGAFTEDEEYNMYNSLIAVLPDGSVCDTVYSKRHLVPFGEYVPMRTFFETVFPPLTELVLSSDDITAGEGANIIELESAKIGSLICFDSIYETLTTDSVSEGAEIIALSTNDSWFLDSAAIYMHNAQAQLRAIENDRYIARSANTGISTFISGRGEVLASIEPLKDGYLVEDIAKNDGRTLYSYIGNTFVYLCIALAVSAFGYEIYRKICRECVDNVKNK